MTLEQAIDLYVQKFGGFPSELMRGMPENRVKEVVLKSLETGKEIPFKSGVKY